MNRQAAKSRARQFRSWLFVPGNRERFVQRAKGSAADVVILDLEDSIVPEQKADARRAVASVLPEFWSGPSRYVRVNGLGTPWFVEDLDAVVRPGIDGICLPKVITAADIVSVSAQIDELERARDMRAGSVRILAAIKTAKGLINAYAIASAHARVSGLGFGGEDFALDLGLGAS